MAKRVALIRRPVSQPRAEDDYLAAIIERLEPELILERLPTEDRDMASLRTMDAVLVFWPYRWLLDAPPLGFGSLNGRTVMLEHDGFGDFTWWFGLQGTWATTFRRHGFDLMVVSGARSLAHFENSGIDTALVHKGASLDRFHDLAQQRSGFCTFGTDYTSRLIMQRKLRRARLKVSRIAPEYSELNDQLNQFAAMVTTMRGTQVRFGSLGRVGERLRRGTFVLQESAPEPMMKVFEGAAAGCAVVTDSVVDLPALGFVDGENIITFDDLDQCVEKVRHYARYRDDLERIGAAAAALVERRHSWRQRAAYLEAAIFPT